MRRIEADSQLSQREYIRLGVWFPVNPLDFVPEFNKGVVLTQEI